LYDGFAQSKARWNVMAQDQLMAEFRERSGDGSIAYWTDDWNGYPKSRERLLSSMRDSKLSNPVVIGGDIHSFWANELKLDNADPRAPVIATEFVGTSITSFGPPYDTFMKWVPENPQIHFFESRKRGYVLVDVAPERMNVAMRIISDATDPKATLSTL